jgi:restriction endonuclease
VKRDPLEDRIEQWDQESEALHLSKRIAKEHRIRTRDIEERFWQGALSPGEYDALLHRRTRRNLRRSRNAPSAKWDNPEWNPEKSLASADSARFTQTDLRSNPSILVVSPLLLDFFLKNPNLLYDITPRQFEEVVAELMLRSGYSVQLGPRGRDQGVDVLAEKQDVHGAELVLVQCKRYSAAHKVGEPIVRQLHATVADFRASRGIVATSSYFTKTALDYIAWNRYRLHGTDKDALLRWMSSLGASR